MTVFRLPKEILASVHGPNVDRDALDIAPTL